MRLIDADEIIARLHDDGLISSQLVALQKIANIPTIDAVPVVRCKECIHAKPLYSDKMLCDLWSRTGIDVFQDGFCNYGDDGTEDCTFKKWLKRKETTDDS